MAKSMNIKRLVLAILAVFAFIFLSDMVIHGKLLDETYKATANLWRGEEEMHGMMCWMFFAQFLFALSFVLLWARGFAGKNWVEGVIVGLIFSLVCVSSSVVQFVVTPLPLSLALSWSAAALIQGAVSGAITALVYCK